MSAIAVAVPDYTEDREQKRMVQSEILSIFELFGTRAMVENLRTIAAGGHTRTCASEFAPAECTCGQREAAAFIGLFDGKTCGFELIAK